MLCGKFELIPIKIGFFTSCSKIRQKSLYYVGQISSKMTKKEFFNGEE